MALPEYYKSKIKLHADLEEQLKKELLALDKKHRESSENKFREEVQALLKEYQFTPYEMQKILGI